MIFRSALRNTNSDLIDSSFARTPTTRYKHLPSRNSNDVGYVITLYYCVNIGARGPGTRAILISSGLPRLNEFIEETKFRVMSSGALFNDIDVVADLLWVYPFFHDELLVLVPLFKVLSLLALSPPWSTTITTFDL